MDILDVFFWFCIGLTIFFAVIIARRSVRARIIARRVGIVKADVNWSALILWLVSGGALLFGGFNRLNEAEKCFRQAQAYEALLDTYDKITASGYQQVAIKTDTVSTESIEIIENKIVSLRETGVTLRHYAIILFALAVTDLAQMTTSFWYITEEGIVLPAFKTPEPFYAVLNGNKIELNYKAQFKNANKVTAFRATPENLAVFGRFMKWEQEQPPQTVPAPQDANIPNDKEQL